MHLLIVHNPVSGTSDPDIVKEAFARVLTDSNGITFERHETRADDAVEDIVRKAIQIGAYDMVAAAGGDGTVSAVANGLAGTDIPLAVIPLGSGNALAREMDIPLGLDQALDLLAGPHHLAGFDMIDAGDRRFLLSLSAGLSARTMIGTTRAEKRRFGKAAYMVKGLFQFFGLNLERFELMVDGKRVQARASEVFIANVGLIGFKQFRLSPRVRPDDGVLHVCIVRTKTLLDYLRLFWSAFLGNPEENPDLVIIPAQEVTIAASRPQPVQGDGEGYGFTPVHARIAARVVRLVVPNEQTAGRSVETDLERS